MLTLASRSPQRRAILASVGIAFTTVPADVEELSTGEPHALASANALLKARAVDGELVLGVDTVVTHAGVTHGKPADARAAETSLRALRGTRHAVVSGLALRDAGGRERVVSVETAVTFRAFDQRTLDWYLASEEWRERAGGYAIQGRGAALVAAVEGDYLNVVGLPLVALLELCPELIA